MCHATGNGGGVTVQVDADAWADHTSAHSEHELDFLIDEGHPCPPLPDPIPDPDPTPTPTPPVLADLCLPVLQLQALADASVAGTIVGSVDVALANDGYALVTFERTGDNGEFITSLGGVIPETDDTPCPTPAPVPPATDTPRPDVIVPPAPVVEVSDAALERQADTFADGAPQAEVEAPAAVEGQLPYTGLSDWLAPTAALLLAAGAFLVRRGRTT